MATEQAKDNGQEAGGLDCFQASGRNTSKKTLQDEGTRLKLLFILNLLRKD